MKISKKEDFQRIKDNVTDLTETLADLKLDIAQPEQEIETKTTPEEFKKGDILQITNNYLGKRGTTG